MSINRHLLAASLFLLAPATWAQSAAGLWDATINFNGAEIPFKFELSGDGANVKGWFFNGDDREISNSGKLENGSLVLNFDSYLAKLTATIKNGVLDGEYGPLLKNMYPIHAVRGRCPECRREAPIESGCGVRRANGRRSMGSDRCRQFQGRKSHGG